MLKIKHVIEIIRIKGSFEINGITNNNDIFIWG